jgi:hypothetical protein
MEGVMGNAQNSSHGDVTLVINGIAIEIPIGFYTAKGKLRKKYKALVAQAILNARRQAIAA